MRNLHCHRVPRARWGYRSKFVMRSSHCHGLPHKVVIAEVDCDAGFALPQSATGKLVIAGVDCDAGFAWPRARV